MILINSSHIILLYDIRQMPNSIKNKFWITINLKVINHFVLHCKSPYDCLVWFVRVGSNHRIPCEGLRFYHNVTLLLPPKFFLLKNLSQKKFLLFDHSQLELIVNVFPLLHIQKMELSSIYCHNKS